MTNIDSFSLVEIRICEPIITNKIENQTYGYDPERDGKIK